MIPLLDSRDSETILDKIKKMAPSYVPEWTFDRENMDAGTALSIIFAEMLEGTIKRYNQVLHRNRMAFLNMLNAGILPANSSEAYVTFFLSTGVKESTLIQKGTKVTAESKDQNGQVVFETAQDMLATPSVPVCGYCIGYNANVINEIDQRLFSVNEVEKKGFIIYDRKDLEEDNFKDNLTVNLQEHCIYFSHSTIFNIKAPAEITLEFRHSQKKYRQKEIYSILSDTKKCLWEFYNSTLPDNPWMPFKEHCIRGDEDRLVLLKKDSLEISKAQIQGIDGNYIRCKLIENVDNDVYDLEFDEVYASSKSVNDDKTCGIVPDKLFINDIELKKNDFYPFGVHFSNYDCFYICCNEVLSKKNSIISLHLVEDYQISVTGDPERKKIKWKNIMKKTDIEESEDSTAEAPETYIEAVIWEYWNGNRWARISMDEQYEKIFNVMQDKKYKNGKGLYEKNMVFTCPIDIEPAPVNGQFDYYIRGRIEKIWNAFRPNAVYLSPKIKKISLQYEYKDKVPLKNIIAKNNMDWKTYSGYGVSCEGNGSKKFIKPFESIGNSYPALYLGFDIAPLYGPIHLYFSMKKLCEDNVCFQPVWEYFGSNGWTPLRIIDNTSSFSTSGSVIFAGPSDFVCYELFEKSKYWIRVYDKRTDLKPSNIEIDGIIINTVRVVQQESIRDEIPEVIADGLKVECRLSRSPIVSEEVFINEALTLSDNEQKEIQKEYEVISSKDEYGNIKEFWVKWKRVDDFLLSGVNDRHYISDPSSGRFVLKGARYGNEFFKTRDKIRVNYKVGGGDKGNVSQYSISGLKNSIAFVEKVVNYRSSFGGCEMELLSEAIDRETKRLKHRDRAVTAEDFEALALTSSRKVVKVRCISNMDANLQYKPGYITLVILPKGDSQGDNFFGALKDKVKRHVLDKTSCIMAFHDKISVVEPVFVEYSINVSVAIEDMDSIVEVEKEIKSALNDYLDCMSGNFDKKGWQIGDYPKTSSFFTLLKSVPKVKYIENLIVNVYELRYGKRMLIGLEKCESMPYMMVKSGLHQVNVKVI
ncbi:baseplate J/gp47 family protein [Pseudobacteroides cellulosolvens]|uniref:Baseplate J family protein n=1 Tax=Pseudobacteroides cellulosolvens ATCC 35603 = DSM 2933 TaxID=398512 RepID=A0A0L6JHZ1_9FIRM|nr:baseplate J/gp47 family protein [Pseudobacteroides cellulosolvens]KNY25328.1 Baseplate J family protein [Pseudobacteroides cellulosolvens ATCC 35603 = DSM 2933]